MSRRKKTFTEVVWPMVLTERDCAASYARHAKIKNDRPGYKRLLAKHSKSFKEHELALIRMFQVVDRSKLTKAELEQYDYIMKHRDGPK